MRPIRKPPGVGGWGAGGSGVGGGLGDGWGVGAGAGAEKDGAIEAPLVEGAGAGTWTGRLTGAGRGAGARRQRVPFGGWAVSEWRPLALRPHLAAGVSLSRADGSHRTPSLASIVSPWRNREPHVGHVDACWPPLHSAPLRLIATRAPAVLASLLAAGAGLFALLVAHRIGWLAVLLALVGLAVALVLLERPGWLAGALIVLTVLVEGRDATQILPDAAVIYEGSAGGVIPLEVLSILMLMGLGIAVLRRRDLILPEPLTLPLLALVIAIVFGLTVGYFDGAPVADMVAVLRKLVYLVILPLVIVNVVRTRAQLRTAVAIVAALALVKALIGVAAVVGGFGFAASEGGGDTTILTYYESTANWVLTLFVVVFTAALMTRAHMPRWMWATAPFALASLVLSYRRSFWIGVSVGLALVVLLGSGRFGRRVVLPLVVVVAVGLGLTLSGQVVTEQQSPLIKRAQSLDPTKLKTNKEDRYRIDERRNVLADISDHPITGMGIGIGWQERYPVSVERKGGRNYVHFAALWYWLHLGILGVVVYLWLFGAAIVAGYGLWKRGREPWLQAIGLGFVGSLTALVIAETTASFTGVELRATIVIGAALGLLAAARRIAATPDE